MTWIDVQHSACKELFVNVVATTNSLWFIALSHRGTDALPDFLKNTDCAEGETFSKRCIAIYKGKIIKIIKYSIYYAVENNETVDQLVRIINLLTTKEIQKLRTQKPFHGIDAVIEQLYKFKDEIKVFGNRYSKII